MQVNTPPCPTNNVPVCSTHTHAHTHSHTHTAGGAGRRGRGFPAEKRNKQNLRKQWLTMCLMREDLWSGPARPKERSRVLPHVHPTTREKRFVWAARDRQVSALETHTGIDTQCRYASLLRFSLFLLIINSFGLNFFFLSTHALSVLAPPTRRSAMAGMGGG